MGNYLYILQHTDFQIILKCQKAFGVYFLIVATFSGGAFSLFTPTKQIQNTGFSR